MQPNKPVGSLTLVLFLAVTQSAVSQEILWVQPYSGYAISGPFTSSDGELPNCPECDCEVCRPGGCKGLIKRMFGALGDRVQRCRREWYFQKQIYHTGYTRPVCPPYCDPGFGYFETHWRQAPPAMLCDPPPLFTAPDLIEPTPPTAPAPEELSEPSEKDDSQKERPYEEEKAPLEKAPPAETAPEDQPLAEPLQDPVGYEKPRYEIPYRENDGATWLRFSPQSRRSTN